MGIARIFRDVKEKAKYILRFADYGGKAKMGSKRTIRIELDTPSPSVDSFIRVLSGTQDAVYAIGRYLERRPVIGRLHHKVKFPCQMVFRHLSMESPLRAELAVVPFMAQTYFCDDGAMKAEDDLGEKCVEIFTGYMETVSRDPSKGYRKVRKLVDSPRHRLDIARRVSKMIPEEGRVFIGTPEMRRPFKLDSDAKEAAHRLVSLEHHDFVSGVEDSKSIIGPVVEARIVDRRYFKIGTTMCLFREEDVPYVEGLLGKVVSLTGKAISAEGKITEFTEIEDLVIKEEETISEILHDSLSIKLKRPIVASVDYESDLIWITDNLGLDICGAGESWDEAIVDFHAQFAVAFAGYVPLKDKALTEDAIAIRDKLRKIVPNWKEVKIDVEDV